MERFVDRNAYRFPVYPRYPKYLYYVMSAESIQINLSSLPVDPGFLVH